TWRLVISPPPAPGGSSYLRLPHLEARHISASRTWRLVISPPPAPGGSSCEDGAQRGHEALVLGRRAGPHPHVLGKAVAVHRAHDDAASEERIVHPRPVPDPHQDEVRRARHVLDAEGRELAAEKRHPIAVHGERAADVLLVLECGEGGGQRERGHG